MMKQRGLFWPLILALILGTGFFVVWAMVGSWAVVTSRGVDSHGHLLFRADGTPTVKIHSPGQRSSWLYTDLADNTLDIPDNEKWLTEVKLPAGPLPSSRQAITWSQRLRTFSDNHRPGNYWYLVSDGAAGGSAYFVGYDSHNYGRIGFLGTAGFRDNDFPPGERFPVTGHPQALQVRVASLQESYYRRSFFGGGRLPGGDIPWWVVYIQTDDGKVYQVDLEQRTVREAVAGFPVRSVAMHQDPRQPPETPEGRLAVRTDEAIFLFNGRNEILHRLPIPAELRDRDFTWLETATGRTVAYTTEPMDIFRGMMHYHIYQMDQSGRVDLVQDAELQLQGGESDGFLMAVIAPLPVVVDVVAGIVRPLDLLERQKAETFPQAFGQGLIAFWPSLLLIHLFSAWLAWLCYRRQVLYAATKAERIVWPLFVFLCGLPGWIGYRYGRSWPPLECCPRCGTVVPRDRVECAHCQADFPLPALRGAEVFA